MSKKDYQKPTMRIVRIEQKCQILAGSVKGLDGNAELDYGGGGSGPARSRSNSGWDDDE